MHLKNRFAFAAALALLTCGVSVAAMPQGGQAALVAQAANRDRSTEENDREMTDCARWKSAWHRLDKVKNELARLQNDFAATDDIRPKLDELVTQTNDAETTAQRRLRTCPAHLQ